MMTVVGSCTGVPSTRTVLLCACNVCSIESEAITAMSFSWVLVLALVLITHSIA